LVAVMDDSVRPALTDRHFQRVEHQLGARRERMVMIEPRSTGMVLIMLRAADEVRAPQFNVADGAIDAEMLPSPACPGPPRQGRPPGAAHV
jgi:non-homologous end joining protein Ku